MNPLPFVTGMANCVIWVIYSAMIKDYFVFFANMPGVILCMFYTVTAMALLSKEQTPANDKAYAQMEKIFMVVITLYTMLALVCGIIITDNETNTLIIGSTAMGINILYYASPCSNLLEVIRTRDATSLFMPMLVANLGCATCWFFYSLLALGDMNIYIPNIIGITLTLTAMGCKVYFGDNPPDNMYADTSKDRLLA